ncbi:hypothetical protein MMPV_000833 [Pyropia vietnamensis]
MISVRAVVAAVMLAVTAVAATVPSASAGLPSVCVTTTNKCCYDPFVCGVVVKKFTTKVAYECDTKVVKKVVVPCHGYGGKVVFVHRTYVAPGYARQCYANQHVVVKKTCHKDVVVAKYFAKICYKEVCHTPIVSGSKPSDGVYGSGVLESDIHGDPTAFFVKHLGY